MQFKSNDATLNAASVSGETYLTDRDIADRYGCSRQSIWNWCKAGKFPRPLKLAPGTSRWRLSDVLAHEAQAAAARGAA